MPLTGPRGDGTCTLDRFTTLIIRGSRVPGILGMRSMKNRRVVLDVVDNQMHRPGPGSAQIDLPPGY